MVFFKYHGVYYFIMVLFIDCVCRPSVTWHWQPVVRCAVQWYLLP